jgi:uridine kinase
MEMALSPSYGDAARPAFDEVVGLVADGILDLDSDHVVRVAVDGVEGSGKTTFADALGDLLKARGAPVIRSSSDGFHHPQAVRYRLGRNSPIGFYLDSYDYVGLRDVLLDPLSPGGSGIYKTAAFDRHRDQKVASPVCAASPGSILVFDGMFLHCPELRRYWDLSVFLDVKAGVAVARVSERDPQLGPANPAAAEHRRYVEGQARYLRECQPARLATMVIDNNGVFAPRLIKR